MIRAFKNSSIIASSPKTFLANDYNAGVSEIQVANAQGIDTYNYVIIEQIPAENFEIIEIDSVAGNTITLVSDTVYPHSFNTVIYFSKSNKIEFSHSEDVFGVKTVLAELDIVGSEEYTKYNDDENTTGYGFVRLFANKTPKEYERYSPANPYSYDRFTARELKRSALEILNKEDSSSSIPDRFIYSQINACESFVMNAKGKSNWSFLLKKDYKLGYLNEGDWSLSLPLDIQDKNTNESIPLVKAKESLTYLDLSQWEQVTRNVKNTKVNIPVEVGHTEITVLDTSDFPDEGSLRIGGQTLEYTGKTDTIFTGVTGITEGVETGKDVFAGDESFGSPRYYTVRNGTLLVYPVVSSNSTSNVYLSYKKKVANIVNSYSKTILPDETAVVDFLCAKIQQRLNDGVVDNTVQMFMNSFEQKVERMLRYDKSGRERIFTANIYKNKLQPKIDRYDE